MNKLVIVTGASRGLGLAICRQLVEQNYQVVAISRSLSDELRALCESHNVTHHAFDLEALDEIPAFCSQLLKRHGRPYALINNAALGLDGVLATMHQSDINKVLNVNIQAPILLTKYFSRAMLLNRCGRVVNVSSIIARTGFNGLSVYAASKAAMEGFTRSLAREVGKAGITINCVAPGYMETEMTDGLTGNKLESIKRRSPLGKLVTPDDAAGAVLYLLGEHAGAITGTVITVDAGSTA